MRSTQDWKHTGRLLAWASAAVLVAGSVGIAAPTFATQPDNPSAQGQAQSQAHSDQASHTHPASAARPGSTTTKTRAGSRPTTPAGHHSGGSGVSLARPNDFQAQADPDGMENGGVDQPGGTGGIDTTTQDGNNGSGNDVDCEDDNRGVGVPGDCKERPAETPTGDEVVPSQGGLPGGSDVPSQGGPVAGQLTQSGPLTTALGAAPTTGLDTVLVSAPTPPSVRPSTQVQAVHTFPASGVLPNTGAGQALVGLAIAALAALALGGGLVRQGRRTARVAS